MFSKKEKKIRTLSSTILFMIVLNLSLSQASAKMMGHISNGHESEDQKYQTEDYKNRYYISCVSNVENAAVFTAPNLQKPYKVSDVDEMYKFQKGTDLIVDRFIEENGINFLSGKILHYNQGGSVISVEKSKSEYYYEEDSDRLYVLPKDWDCRLRKGDREAGSSCDGIIAAFGKLSKKYETECNKLHN